MNVRGSFSTPVIEQIRRQKLEELESQYQLIGAAVFFCGDHGVLDELASQARNLREKIADLEQSQFKVEITRPSARK